MMKLDDFNVLLKELDSNPGREQVMKTAFAFLEWMGIKPMKEGKEKLLAPKKEDLKKYLTRHPVTNQFQLYRLSADDEAISVRFAFLKKFRKDQITQLIDKESIVHFQGAPPIIQTLPSAPPYTFHIIAPAEQNRLYIVLNKGDQKRIVSFRRKLTQTQFQKIVPQWQNIGTKSKPEIAELLWKSLDIKEVNKEFYKQIKTQFDALVGIAKVQAPKTNEEEAKQFAVRLIGRYIFCWFLKEKGIISEQLLGSATIREHKKDFFQKYLYQLFFNTLNEEVPSRNPFKAEGGLDELYDTIPYLNGGLFEKHPEDTLFKVLDLNAWLIAFVSVLEDFDFTVDESSSQYQQVAIDPEMLGRIFENLLASQNPETEKMANQRKAFGAFYTPREIVDYMVNQALKSYLEEALLPKDETAAVVEEPLVEYKGTLFQDIEPKQTLINFDPAKKAIADQRRKRLQEHLDKFFSPDCASNPFDKGDVPLVQQKLSEVKILDPACGSGAFPMGVLLRLMELRQLVGHGHRNNYDLKSEILSRNIYGVDIMPMAVEIARLRAWLSLVLEAEYKPQDRKNNFGVSALPNLDFKFVCANSLIDSGYDAFLENVEHNITLMRLDGEIQKLERLRENYFDPKGNKQRKLQLQHEFAQTKNYIKTEFGGLKKTWNLGDFLSKVDDWNPFDDSHPSTFFSPGWMFGIKEGFDIVIGNPPYVYRNADNEDLKQYFSANYKSAEGNFDLYKFFLEKTILILRKNGNSCLIVPNTFLTAKSYSKLRRFIMENALVIEIFDLGENLFEGVTIESLIVRLQKTNNGGDSKIKIQRNRANALENLEASYSIDLREIFKAENSFNIYLNQKANTFINKIRKDSIELGKIAYCTVGINTGYVKDKLTAETRIDKTYHKMLSGRDIGINTVNWKKIWIKYDKEFVDSFGDKGRSLPPQYIFTEEKILVQRTRRGLKRKLVCYYDDEGFYNLNRLSNIISTDNEFSLKYIHSLLNSSLLDYYFNVVFNEYEVKPVHLSKLPVKIASGKKQQIFISKIEKIISLNKQDQDTTEIEKEIDVLVYKLYELTYEEVKVIDPEFWKSEAEYVAIQVE